MKKRTMKTVTKLVVGFFVTVCISTSMAVSANAITIDVLPSLAPNAYGSPSYSTYVSNAIYALENGLSAFGDPNSPTHYQNTGSSTMNVTAAQGIVTGFPSWLGQANPAGLFANELGNRMTFGVHIYDGEFSISQLSFTGVSNDPNNALGFTFNGTYVYNSSYVGLNYGLDSTKGTSDDIWISSGAASQLVNELFGRGSGNSLAAYIDSSMTNQESINNAAEYFNTLTTFTGTYTLNGVSGSGEFQIAPVPEPSTFLLFGAGLAGVAFLRRRVRK